MLQGKESHGDRNRRRRIFRGIGCHADHRVHPERGLSSNDEQIAIIDRNQELRMITIRNQKITPYIEKLSK
ncbi:MAG: hypothetical protein MZV63_55470 [Marinilabiliales bacterium]|nr:hypothetical protein [Marinilabiliales bacterium]